MDTTFAELPLGPKLQAAISAAGYVTPTPIQAQAIPVAVTGRDVLGIAQTGTGKTASFVLPMIERLEQGRARARMPRSLILAPTRELAAQCAQSFEKYGINHKLDVALLIGGVSMDDQVKKLDRGVDVLIATPGRLIDHFQRGRIMLMGVEILVIDEADRMLDMGFIPDIEKICKLLPPRRQTLFFSATMPPEITRLVSQFLKDPLRIEVARPATTAKTITQLFHFCATSEDWEKREMLRELIRSHPVKNAIIFCNRKRDVAILHKSLAKHGFNAGALHGDMDQKARMDTLDKFRAGEILLLAASDVAARGLDIPDVSHIFNYDIPWAGDDYVHRIGRTGRAGKEGTSVSLVTPEDLKLIKDIEKVTGETPVWIGDAPTEDDFADSGRRRGRGRGAAVRGGGAVRGAAVRGRGDRGGGDRDRSGPRKPERSGSRREGGEERSNLERPNVERSGEEPRVQAEVGGRRPGRRSAERLGRTGRTSESTPVENGRSTEAALHTTADDAVAEVDGGRNRPSERPSGERSRERPGDRHRERPQRSGRRPAPQHAIPGMEDQPVLEPVRREQPQRERERERERQPQRDVVASNNRVERPVREPRPRKPEPGGGVGFADNVPAFLRRPVRPVKVASE